MTKEGIKRRGLLHARLGMLICAAVTAAGTFAWLHGFYFFWAVDCIILVAAGACVVVNYRIIRQNS